MNPQPENFERLQKLLALKRHEQPPPGYFEKLSDRIADQIALEKELGLLPWWRRLAASFEFKPAFVCAVGVVLCGLFSAGVITALQVDPASSAAAEQVSLQAQSTTDTGLPPTAPLEVQSSIEPVGTSSPSPFDHIDLKVQRASFSN
jgi:hypothetical protein